MARTLVKTAGQQVKNLIINGNFDFWQRGTSLVITAGQYLADRWRTFTTAAFSGGTITTSRDTDVPTFAQSGVNSSFSMKVAKSAGAISVGTGDYLMPSYAIEGYDYAQIHNGKSFRLQFWMKVSVAGTYTMHLTNSAESRSYMSDIVITNINTWEKKTFDIISDTAGTWLLDNSRGLRLDIVLAAGTNVTQAPGSWASTASKYASTNQTNGWATNAAASSFWISQVILTPGNYNTDTSLVYQRVGDTIADELLKCQRYAYSAQSDEAGTLGSQAIIGAGQCISTTQAHIRINFLVSMRTAPTIVATGVGGNFIVTSANGSTVTTNANLAILSNSQATDGAVIVASVASGLVAGNAAELWKNGQTQRVLFDAEL